jgi:glycolate oxidase FAD binding subunit
MPTLITATDSIASVVEQVNVARQLGKRLLPVGSGTKPLLCRADNDRVLPVSMRGISGIVEYQPFEFTITAHGGTPIRELANVLAEKGQFLPFDPLWVEQGATVGGTIATGISGPGRMLFGGIRDFILGVQFIDGLGNLVRGGGKVVKNAAGFDLPKMMVGSLGRLGLLTEITLKVFPAPVGYRTMIIAAGSIKRALPLVADLMSLTVDIVANEVDSTGAIYLRLAGDEPTTQKLAARIRSQLGSVKIDELLGDVEHQWWQAAAELRWGSEAKFLIRIPLTVDNVPKLENELAELGVLRQYSAAFNAVWIGLDHPTQLDRLDAALAQWKLKGVVVRGEGKLIIGDHATLPFAQRIQAAIDPHGVFAQY